MGRFDRAVEPEDREAGDKGVSGEPRNGPLGDADKLFDPGGVAERCEAPFTLRGEDMACGEAIEANAEKRDGEEETCARCGATGGGARNDIGRSV